MEVGADQSAMLSFLKKRELERRLDAQKRKDTKNSVGAENEKLECFEKMFSKNVEEIEFSLMKVNEIPITDLPEFFNNISKNILTLQKFVAASNIFLRSYHIERCQNTIQSLSLKSKELEDKLIPKKKFGFTKKKKAINHENQTHNYENDIVDGLVDKCKNTSEKCEYINKKGELIVMNQSDVFRKDITIQKMQNCCIEIHGSPSTLHLSHLKDCYVFSGPVSTSIFAENCENSCIILACQQLRLHMSKNLKIYLHVTSRAIMEDCTNISVAPYNWKYEGIEKDFEVSGLDVSHNNWSSIDDFNWLNIHKPSPNWKVLDESEKTIDWSEVVVNFKLMK